MFDIHAWKWLLMIKVAKHLFPVTCSASCPLMSSLSAALLHHRSLHWGFVWRLSCPEPQKTSIPLVSVRLMWGIALHVGQANYSFEPKTNAVNHSLTVINIMAVPPCSWCYKDLLPRCSWETFHFLSSVLTTIKMFSFVAINKHECVCFSWLDNETVTQLACHSLWFFIISEIMCESLPVSLEGSWKLTKENSTNADRVYRSTVRHAAQECCLKSRCFQIQMKKAFSMCIGIAHPI